jgi:hypothetical protein
MPRIRFTVDPKLPRDWADKPYRKGTEHDVSADEADRWLRRGVAEIVADRPESTIEETGPEPVEIPDDWRDQHHMARFALARKLTDEPVDSAAAADDVIAAEVERRARPA